MLKKLLKYDLMQCLKPFPVFLIVMLGLSLAVFLASYFNIILIQVYATMFLVLAGVGAFVTAIVVTIIRYYKGLFGAPAYLYRTIPATTGQHMASKYLSAGIAMLIGVICMLASILCAVFINVPDADFKTIWDALQVLFGSEYAPLIVFAIIALLLNVCLMVTEIFFAITLAHTKPFIKNNILFAFLGLFAVSTCVSMLEFVAMLLIPLSIGITSGGTVGLVPKSMLESLFEASTLTVNGSDIVVGGGIGIGSVIIDFLAIVAMVILTYWLLNKKTSIK